MNTDKHGQEEDIVRRVVSVLVVAVILAVAILGLAGNLTVKNTVTGETEKIHGFGTNI